jgi:hypothetical protein
MEDFNSWKSDLEARLAGHLFENPEKLHISFKEAFHLNKKLSDQFLGKGIRAERVECAFREFYELSFEDGEPLELFDLGEDGIAALAEWCELRHPAGILALLVPEGWLRSYLSCSGNGRLRKLESV